MANRVKPAAQRRRGDEEGGLAPHEAEPQYQHQERGEHGGVGAGDDQGVVGARIAELLGPDALHLVRLADHDGLHHAGLVRLALVEMGEAFEGHHAQAGDGGLEARPALAGQDGDLGAGGHGGGPVDIAAGQVARVIERAGIAEIARAADARFELHALAKMQCGRRLAFVRVGGDLDARAGIEFHDETFAVAGKSWGLDHAAA
jgi:hypothetical protein